MSEKFGTYVLVIAGSPIRQEWTNIGVILFDELGGRSGYRMDDLDRAVARGDLSCNCGWSERLEKFPLQFATLEDVRRGKESAALAMSLIRLGAEGKVALASASGDAPTIERLYEEFIG